MKRGRTRGLPPTQGIDKERRRLAQTMPGAIDAVYRLQLNEFCSETTLQMVIEHRG